MQKHVFEKGTLTASVAECLVETESLLRDELAAVTVAVQFEQDHLPSMQVCQTFAALVALSQVRGRKLDIPATTARKDALSHLDEFAGAAENVLKFPVPEEERRAPLAAYLTTVLRLFRSWARVRPNAEQWSARNAELAQEYQTALNATSLEVLPSTEGFRYRHVIKEDLAREQASQVHAHLLFWKHLHSDAAAIGFCKYGSCGLPFRVTEKRTTYCSPRCGAADASNRVHRRKRCEENYQRLKSVVQHLRYTPANDDWKRYVLERVDEVTLRWLSDLEADANSSSESERIERLLSRIYDDDSLPSPVKRDRALREVHAFLGRLKKLQGGAGGTR